MKPLNELELLLTEGGGTITTSAVTNAGIPRQYLKIAQEKGMIDKVARGVYVEKDKYINDFYLVQHRYKKAIFSHNTALYFYGMTDRVPPKYDLTFPSTETVVDEWVASHYIKPELFELGLTTMQLDDGTTIKLYNLERTVCDIIRDRHKTDPQVFNDTLRNYLERKDKDLIQLQEYAEKFHIDKILRTYMEVL